MRSLNLATKAKLTPLLLGLSIAYGGNLWAQTCHYDTITPSTPDSQLTDHGDGTVTDTATGLMWKQCSEGQTGTSCTGDATYQVWEVALELATDATFADHSDWRLPSLHQLLSVVERACEGPSINATRFPSTPLDFFWSSTANEESNDYALGVNFDSGNDYSNFRDYSLHVRLVRAGQ